MLQGKTTQRRAGKSFGLTLDQPAVEQIRPRRAPSQRRLRPRGRTGGERCGARELDPVSVHLDRVAQNPWHAYCKRGERVRQRNSAATSSIGPPERGFSPLPALRAPLPGMDVRQWSFEFRSQSSPIRGLKPEQQLNPPTSYAKRRLFHPPSHHPAPFGDGLARGLCHASPDHETSGKPDR